MESRGDCINRDTKDIQNRIHERRKYLIKLRGGRSVVELIKIANNPRKWR